MNKIKLLYYRLKFRPRVAINENGITLYYCMRIKTPFVCDTTCFLPRRWEAFNYYYASKDKRQIQYIREALTNRIKQHKNT